MTGAEELLERWFTSFNGGDYATTLDCMAEDVEYHELPGLPGARGGSSAPGVYRGKEEVVSWYVEFLAGWETLTSEPSAIDDLGDGHVVADETWRGRGAHSGVDVEMRASSLFTVRDGRIARVEYFRTRDEALAAAR
jgi:ketosteroid isomerase-like protein